MSEFEGKVVMITGAARGLGRHTAVAFAREGARVVLTDIDEKGGHETLRLVHGAGGEGVFLRSDASIERDVAHAVDTAVETYGRLDCAVNNAAIEVLGLVVDQTEETWDRTFNTNAKGVMFCMKHQIRRMLKSGGGAIVNHSSITSHITGMTGSSAYAASKAAVVGLSKSVALEVAREGISINCIAAGGILADEPSVFSDFLAATKLDHVAAREFFPIGRFGEAEELTSAVLFLCSTKSRFITGTTLVIDGGLTTGPVRLPKRPSE
jgi:NAD(P)-dependent dehydrogenase (short-subunit alcohol dehydrogenase family)